MSADVCSVLFDGDPNIVPLGRIKWYDIGPITLTKVNVSRDSVSIEFIEAQSVKACDQIVGVTSGRVRRGCH